MLSRKPIVAVLLSLTVVLHLRQTVAAEPSNWVNVLAASGRSFTGNVDERSDETTLWLRVDHGASRIWRPIRWEAIKEVRLGKRELKRAEALALATKAPARPLRRQVAPAGNRTMAEQADQWLEPARPVSGIDFDVRAGNWDNDAAVDGLVAGLRVVDPQGHALAVAGTIEIELVAVRYRGNRSQPTRGRSPVGTVARWTRTFSAQQVEQGATWRLPYGGEHPQRNTNWKSNGLVLVKVTLPGHGTFTASRDFVRLRPQSPTRDEHFRVTGSPFLAGERAGR